MLLHFRLQFILLGLKEVLNDGVHQFVQFLLQLCQVTVEEAVNFEVKTTTTTERLFSPLGKSDLTTDSPVTWSGAQLGVVFNFRLRAAGAHGGHAPVGEGERDHLAGPGRGKDLGGRRRQRDIRKQSREDGGERHRTSQSLYITEITSECVLDPRVVLTGTFVSVRH